MSQSTEEIPWTFINTNGIPLTNYSANDIVIRSDVIPVGYIGIVRDVAVMFTTAGGTLAWGTRFASGGVNRWTQNVTTNTTGTANIVLGHDDRIELIITSAGVGVIDVTFSGVIKKQIIPGIVFPIVQPSLVGTGGF